MNRIDLADLLHLIISDWKKKQSWVLWFGSPISLFPPSSIPTTGPIIDGFLRALRDDPQATRKECAELARAYQRMTERGDLDVVTVQAGRRRMPFEAVLGEVGSHTGDYLNSFIARLFEPGRANALHEAIAHLADAGVFNLAITTNFDEQLDKIWPLTGTVLIPGAKAPGSGEPTPVPTTVADIDQPVLVKLHGTVSAMETVAATPEGLRQRANDEWRERIGELLENRNVLFVGYGFQDTFDLTPGLRSAQANRARFFRTDREGQMGLDLSPLEFTATTVIDLAKPMENPLILLANSLVGSGTSLVPAPLDAPRQVALAESAAGTALRECAIDTADRLKAFGALYYWLEEGRSALKLFALAGRRRKSAVDDHLLARSFLRARRYRKAVTRFKLMLNRELPEDPDARFLTAIDWHCGAGFCASAGGRVHQAARQYARAANLLKEKSKTPSDLPPYLADQFLRGRAETSTRLAQESIGLVSRRRHLDAARRDLLNLRDMRDLELRIPPLIDRDLARIEIMEGHSDIAISMLEQARKFFVVWGDPDGLGTTERLIAVADTSRRAEIIADESAIARSNHRWLEWFKLQALRLGVTGYGRASFLQMRMRNLFIASWDLLKESLLLGRY